jgi:hypothetical protein
MSSIVYMLSDKEPQLGHNSVQRTPTDVLDFGFTAGETYLEGLQNEREGCRLSSHRAYLRQVPSLNAFLQGFPIHLQYYSEQVQEAVPGILMPAVVEEIELSHIEREIDLRDASIGAHHLAQPRPGALQGVAVYPPRAYSPAL